MTTAPLRHAWHWITVHAHRHIPFACYATATTAAMAYTMWTMTHLG